jgi:hypothetical protein
MIRAFGADDVARLRLVFRKLRFQMIADTVGLAVQMALRIIELLPVL